MAYDETKFRNFARLLEAAKRDKHDVVVVSHPQVVGDTYEELVENLNRLSDAKLQLCIVPRRERGGAAGRS